LISDLYEGGNRSELEKRLARVVTQGVKLICLLALNDEGAPAFDHHIAAFLANLGVPAFASTPDQFPEIMAVAIGKGDLSAWAASQNIVTAQ
jgi:VWA domain containing CoxE-like protein.